MANYIVCLVIQRLILPLILASCVLFRPVGLSLPYLWFLFYLPHIPVATKRSMRGHTGYFLKFLIAISVLILLAPISFQILLAVLGNEFIEKCELLEVLLRHVGVVRYDNLSIPMILLWSYPEVVMFIASITIFILLKKFSAESEVNNQIFLASVQLQAISVEDGAVAAADNTHVLKHVARVLSVIALCVSGSLQPSVISLVYFIVFLGAATWYACNKELERAYAVMLRITLVFLMLHITALLAYQTPWPQEFVPENTMIPRLLSFTPLMRSACGGHYIGNITGTDIRIIEYNLDLNLDFYFLPIVLIICYYVLTISATEIASQLMRSKSLRGKNDPTDNETEDENTEVEPTEPEEEKPKLLQRLGEAAVNTAKFIYKNSYIFTNMTMMMWSIFYHSWIGFIFLIWSNVIWIVPNQRKNMLKCTPYIIVYAECLLLAQFLFGMQLTEDELPSSVIFKGVNILDQLGFRKELEYPVRPLLLKSAFTVMFWASCRQYMSEREVEKGQSALGNMMVNQQITVAMVKPLAKKGLLVKIGVLVNAILVRFWIWAVALTLFMSGFSGSKMTVFRILYMVLFLIFVLYFQFSWRLWRKTMYAFWLVVIIYSMIILILVYIYQFKQFPEFCVEYLMIPLEIQRDIGLEVYATKQLLLHLITPTAVVIITVVQLHYCHTKFLEWSEIPPRTKPDDQEYPMSETSSAYGHFSAPKSENEGSENEASEMLRDFKFRKFSKKEITAYLQKLKLMLIELIEFILVIVEMHALKAILVYAFYIGVRRVNLVHISFVILCVVGVRLKTEGQIYVTKLISLISSIILIITMVYQVEYIDKRNYETDCGMNSTGSLKYLNNTAEWFGLDKQNKQTKLMGLIKYYFLYINFVTFHTVLIVRQTIKRIKAGISPRTPLVLFPNIIRRDADKDLPHFFKYLANYVFYKFGLEICLVGMVGSVAIRMDFFACCYAIWLCKFYNLSRADTVEQWPKLKKFIIAIIPIQYILLVGLPPLLCVDYWWNITFLKDFGEWAMLPENTNEFRNLHWRKLIVDFILLLLVCRQTLVFRIEERYKDDDVNFPGGTNKSVLKDIDQMGIVPFENPTPDYIERIRNWLDIAKRGFFMMFFWVTLCIVFITGSSRVNLFSVGYLIGAFTFLWEGTDFYLRPIQMIIKRWNYLIGYNCISIAIKASLQMFGCLSLGFLTEHTCFLVQLFGISCVCSPDKPHDEDCTVPVSESRLFLDGICFTILLLQRRVFCSYYFCHMINETKASAILASRGAELLDDLARKEVKMEQEREAKVLQKIKSKMDRIKATQQKILESVHSQRTHQEDVFIEADPANRKPPILMRAVLSGDYYMFEEVEDEFELDIIDPRAEEEEEERQSTTRRRLSKKTSFGQLLTQMKESAEKERQEEAKRQKALRRASMPNFDVDRSTSLAQEKTVHSEPIRRVTHYEDRSRRRSDSAKPGTSRDSLLSADEDQEGLIDGPPPGPTPVQKLMATLKKVPAFISSILVSVTIRVHRLSKSYRYVMKTLAKEKKALKEQPDFGAGIRTGSTRIWTPITSHMRVSRTSSESEDDNVDNKSTASIESDTQSCSEIRNIDLADAGHTPLVTTPNLQRKGILTNTLSAFGPKGPQRDDIKPEDKIVDFVAPPPSKPKKVFEEDPAFADQEHSILTELLQSLWYAILAHTDLICYTMVFFNQINSSSILSLPLPLMVLMWGTLTFPRPSKTFWVTMIAYTQIIVILKCVCQYEVLWWNQGVIPSNKPFAPPRILGIERKEGYADNDLALLLVVFCHRFILKSLGLWKSDAVEEPLEDGPYTVEATDIVTKGLIDTADNDTKLQKIIQDDLKISLKKVDSVTALAEQPSNLVFVEKTPENTANFFPGVIKMSLIKYSSAVKEFINQLVDNRDRKSADVYGFLFMCDFINFFVIIFGFSAFGTQEGDGGVMSYLEENKVPLPFLLMLIIQFLLMIIDRAIYLRKQTVVKIMFQIILSCGIHIWMFFVLPATTERTFNATRPPIMYYLIKCYYFLLSAYQIRSGYPQRILGNFLTKGFGFINSTGYKIYMSIPFLFELRTLMDWIWTDTSMTLMDWLKMEDIFTNIYSLKCSRTMDTDMPTPSGQKKKDLPKYIMGGTALTAVIVAIWFPLALFAFSSAVGEPNIPHYFSMELRIGTYDPVYFSGAQNHAIQPLTGQWSKFVAPYGKDKEALGFLGNYEDIDVGAIRLGTNSSKLWNISPPDRLRFLHDLVEGYTITCKLSYTVFRTSYSKETPAEITEDKKIQLEKDDPAREALIKMLYNQTDTVLHLPFMLPKFLKLRSNGFLKPIHPLTGGLESDDDEPNYRNVSLRLHSTEPENVNETSPTIQYWWEVKEECNDQNYAKKFKDMPFNDCSESMVIYVFNDKLFPSTLSSLAAGGIIGIYSTFILFFWRFLRNSIFTGSSAKIMFEDFPYVDRLLQLCLDIYLVRETMEFGLEEDLFAKLIFLYRSPETMIKWTRPKHESGDDDEDSSGATTTSKKGDDSKKKD